MAGELSNALFLAVKRHFEEQDETLIFESNTKTLTTMLNLRQNVHLLIILPSIILDS